MATGAFWLAGFGAGSGHMGMGNLKLSQCPDMV
jgi:hypothetical protein